MHRGIQSILFHNIVTLSLSLATKQNQNCKYKMMKNALLLVLLCLGVSIDSAIAEAAPTPVVSKDGILSVSRDKFVFLRCRVIYAT